MTAIQGTALVTGASGGIGQAIARALAARGAQVVLTGRRADVLEPLAQELRGRALAIDLAERDAVQRLVEQAGEVELLIANAALPGTGMLDDFSVAEVDRALDVNLRAPVLLAKLLGEQMARRGHGHIVFISSLSGKAASPRGALYSATKFGMRGFALSLREDLKASGVGVSTIFPGFIRDAGMWVNAGASLPKGVGTRSPQDVAEGVVRAIERNRAEVDVAPFGLRVGAALAGLAPELSARVSHLLGGTRIAEALAEGHRENR
ncbi:MAG: SDR family NAD(P)-dependent oxidoreductase [Actinobacteria bacterium]|nr:SDR family NAD(P)-dependent oxidoreductase [Actinomycetota bacterium]